MNFNSFFTSSLCSQEVIASAVVSLLFSFALSSIFFLFINKRSIPQSNHDLSLGPFKKPKATPLASIEELEKAPHIPYSCIRYSEKEQLKRSNLFYEHMQTRRSLRFYSSEPFDIEILKNCIRTSGTAPSGAHTQPWRYIIIQNQETKDDLRDIVENQEKINYEKRMSQSWLQDLEFCKTNWEKPYLSEAPYVVVAMKAKYSFKEEDGSRQDHYYPEQSMGLSVGLFLAALTDAGLVTLTSTPMGADKEIRNLLDRPNNEKVFLLMPVGFPSDEATVPNIERLPLDNILSVI